MLLAKRREKSRAGGRNQWPYHGKSGAPQKQVLQKDVQRVKTVKKFIPRSSKCTF
jgi:hypothetical protein